MPVAWVSSREVHCVAPEPASGSVSVELTQNDQQYTSDLLHYEYVEVALHSIHPLGGPTLGGTEVRVLGANLHPPGVRGLFCQFAGAEVVQASYDGEEAVRCVTPPAAAAGWLAVHVINNDAIYATSVAFEYYEGLAVSSIEPVVGTLGGGTLLTVRGSGFTPSTTALVRFGEHRAVVARVLSSAPGALLCTTDAMAARLPGELVLQNDCARCPSCDSRSI